MGIKVIERNNGVGADCLTTFLCDTESDIIKLPTNCSAGSLAIIAEPHKIMILNTEGKWK